MTCMCGDPYCPSCGPAQGVNIDREQVEEWLACAVFADLPDAINIEWMAGYVAEALGKHCEVVTLDSLIIDARHWASMEAKKLAEQRRAAKEFVL